MPKLMQLFASVPRGDRRIIMVAAGSSVLLVLLATAAQLIS
jgi:hypothetical protein